MNFYTLTSKKNKLKWIQKVFFLSFFLSCLIFTVNFVVDPYNITSYNILDIKYKFARDDRTEKVNYFKSLPSFENVMIGSSRVYSINPQKVSDILGGSTYNFGVGTATIEDHLGILKYLIKLDKIPKNIIMGVDFYTFNPDIPPNKYFLRNKELNFLSYSNYTEDYLGKFFSIDAFRASVKTLINHYSVTTDKPRFDKNGFAGHYEKCDITNKKESVLRVKKEIKDEKVKIYSGMSYFEIDKKRVSYYNEIKQLAKKHHIKIYLFTTPLHPILLKELKNGANTRKALSEFITYLSTFDNFTNLYDNSHINEKLCNFHGATHTTTKAGDIIMEILLNKADK